MLVTLALLIDEVDDVIGGHTELAGRLRQLAAPLVEQLAVLGIAREADEDQQERMKHYDSPTARR
ncbi:MAG: hypothetical protein DMF87_20915 [Acidobacteria bacterium]|nr:MAG: hypothetical protein DMF87_20915 [Acidobacteriota bacterium]